MKRKSFGIICTIVVWSLFAVGALADTVSVTDMAGRQVSAPFDPDRIVCIGPGALRLIVYLQAEAKVVGVEDLEKMNPGGRPYWIAHPELAKLPRCGPGGPGSINKKPDLEAVLSVRPQVLFITYMDGSLVDEIQKTSGIPTVVLNYGAFATFDEAVYDALRIAGTILNRKERAAAVVTYIESLRSDLQHRTAAAGQTIKPTAYVGGIGYRGIRGIESTEQRYIPFEWLAVDNAAGRVKAGAGSHVFMDKESLLKIDPPTIFIDGGGLALVAEDYRKKPEFYRAMQAFANGRVYRLLPFNWYVTNIDTALADAYAIGKILYAARFADIDPEQKADEIYTYLVGKPVYLKMKSDYGAIGQRLSFSMKGK
jgi:iron complex transport system substrate-binding protein